MRAFDGTASLIQPLIAPLYDGRTALEVVSALNGKPGIEPMDLVKDSLDRRVGRRRIDAPARATASRSPTPSRSGRTRCTTG